MLGFIGIGALSIILFLSLIITRVATEALMLTGLSRDVAEFQARSVFTGIGFSTNEAEQVMTDPARRRIIMALMLLRSAGLISVILSLLLSFSGTHEDTGTILQRLLWLLVIIIAFWVFSKNRILTKYMRAVISRALTRYTDLRVMDYVSLLHLSDEYVIDKLAIESSDWLADKTIEECSLRAEGVMVIGIIRDDGSYVGIPKGRTHIYQGDTLLLYGRRDNLSDLDIRKKGPQGDKEHNQAISKQQEHDQKQDDRERQYSAASKDKKMD